MEAGNDRFRVVSELGQPVFSEKQDNGESIDVFKFVQGHSAGTKAGKSLFYGLAAVATLGLSELVTTPLEGAIGEGSEVQLKVTYDATSKVKDVLILKDDRWLPMHEIQQQQKQ